MKKNRVLTQSLIHSSDALGTEALAWNIFHQRSIKMQQQKLTVTHNFKTTKPSLQAMALVCDLRTRNNNKF